MSTVTEGLVLALRSLPKAEKGKVISHLWEDPDFGEAMADLVVKKLLESHGNRVVKHFPRPDNGVETDLTSKERGQRLRENYVLELQKNGIPIDQVDGVWAKTRAGLWVAIPTATERRPNRWFLGLPENVVRERIHKGGVAVVLLCQSKSGSTLDFVIPSGKIQEIADNLSKSKGQLKFNLSKLGNHYHLVMPRSSPLDVSDYKGEVAIFQS